ncbi:MAG: S41 family peptidase [Psychrosphaera sp.]|nr:S41 family peptidase [Psychrosphaera sp.]
MTKYCKSKIVKHLQIPLLCLAAIFGSTAAVAQALTTDEVSKVINGIAKQLVENYIYPEKAKKMADFIKTNLADGKYNSFTDPGKFAQAVEKDLHSVVLDKHLAIILDKKYAQQKLEQAKTPEDDAITAQELKDMQRNNFGFQQVKMLPGNLGYLDLRQFISTQYASETAAAAMNFLSNSDALIIDLRKNGGGEPNMIQFLTSYLYDVEPVHISGFYWRPTDIYTENYTLPYVPGKRRPDIDVYILTSKRTFSAAEEFSYNLKHLKRATVIGEVTGGGAHPGDAEAVNDRFLIWIPTGRSTNPITKTNWESVGVQPDVKVAAIDALAIAQKLALEKLAKKDGADLQYYQWALTAVKAQLSPVNLSTKTLKSYIGKYGPLKISLDHGQLFSQYKDRPKQELTALDKTLFGLRHVDYIRLAFIVENNQIVGLKEHFDNGRTRIRDKVN